MREKSCFVVIRRVHLSVEVRAQERAHRGTDDDDLGAHSDEFPRLHRDLAHHRSSPEKPDHGIGGHQNLKIPTAGCAAHFKFVPGTAHEISHLKVSIPFS